MPSFEINHVIRRATVHRRKQEILLARKRKEMDKLTADIEIAKDREANLKKALETAKARGKLGELRTKKAWRAFIVELEDEKAAAVWFGKGVDDDDSQLV